MDTKGADDKNDRDPELIVTTPPPVLNAGQVAPKPPAIHPTKLNWFMMDGDQSRRGPLTIEELINLAKCGQVQRSTLVWHSIASSGEWIPAERVAVVASHLPQSSPPSIAPVVAVRPWTRVYKRSSGFSFGRDVLVPGVMVCSLALAYMHYTGNKSYLATMQQLMSRSPAMPLPAVKKTEVVPMVRSDRERLPKPAPSMRYEPSKPSTSPTPPRNDEVIPPQRTGNLGELLSVPILPAIGKPLNQKTETITLNVGSGRQIVELRTLSPAAPIKVASVDGFSQSAIIEPPNSELKESATTKIKPFGDDSIYLILRQIPNGECPEVSIECKTSLDWIGGDSLSADRLKRKRIAMMKQLGTLNAQLTAAATEQANLTAFIEREVLKKLDDVKAARNRIRILEPLIASLRTQIISGQSQIGQFDAFCTRLDSTFTNAKVVFTQDVNGGV